MVTETDLRLTCDYSQMKGTNPWSVLDGHGDGLETDM